MQNALHRYSRIRAGSGLLLLRVGLAALLLLEQQKPSLDWPVDLIAWVRAAIAFLLLIGIGTPYVAAVAGGLFAVQACFAIDPTAGHAATAVISLTCMMIGGGPWSLDAALFGRRRIEIPRA